MKVNFNNDTGTPSINNKNKVERKHKKVTFCLAAFTFFSLIWIALLSDTFSQAAQVEPKDYAAEEIRNRELANQTKETTTFDKLKDENAVQYVNDAISEEIEETTEAEETIVLPKEQEEDPDGEEF